MTVNQSRSQDVSGGGISTSVPVGKLISPPSLLKSKHCYGKSIISKSILPKGQDAFCPTVNASAGDARRISSSLFYVGYFGL